MFLAKGRWKWCDTGQLFALYFSLISQETMEVLASIMRQAGVSFVLHHTQRSMRKNLNPVTPEGCLRVPEVPERMPERIL